PTEMRANAFAAAFLMPEQELREAVGNAGITRQDFAQLACDLLVTPSALAYQMLRFRLIDSGTCDSLKRTTAAQAASLAERGEQMAERIAASSAVRAPGLLLRDTFRAYESGATTLRPYANLLEVDAEELRIQLEQAQDRPGLDG